jgi:hypothetical protein
VRVKYWEIIADNLSKAGWSWGCVSTLDSKARTIWIVDAHRDDGKRFVVRADGKLTAFSELESATRGTSGCSDAPEDSLAFTGNFPVRPSLRPGEYH